MRRFKQIVLPGLAVALLAGAGLVQRQLNRARADLGVMSVALPDSAPPVLQFTTVALGGFRGLIANFLWIRASDLQEDGKYFEMVQLADWITKLQPHMTEVWVLQAWNMAYNISVKFTDFADRWRWVQRGIELLRDQGLRYNPREPRMYRELAWFFQHKMGQNLDDAHNFYKFKWAEEMTRVLGVGRPNWDELINPQTDEARQRAKILREKYKLDARKMKEADDRYGPLEWRLPEAHAIYWAALGLEMARKEELIVLRRVIYQSMALAFQRGRLISIQGTGTILYDQNLDLLPRVNAAYEQLIAEEEQPNQREGIKRAHQTFLLGAVYFLYAHNRMADAAKWLKLLRAKYPDALPPSLTLDEYAVRRVTETLSDTNPNQSRAVLEGLLVNSYVNLAVGEDDRAQGFSLLARRAWEYYQKRMSGNPRVALPPFEEMQRVVREQLLDPEKGLTPQLSAQLRSRLGLPAPTNAPPK